MSEVEREKTVSTDDKKQKIRERYKGVDPDSLDVIPAAPKIDIYEPGCHQRVAVYARVSTDDPRQTSSYELQKNYYEDMVNRNPNWDLVDIYADEGISGTSLKHRDAFIRMIEDCRLGKIDLIVTKSVSRFARNIVDCIGYVRQLAAMKPPVGVMFETERIYTLDGKSEMSLSFIATLAQEESHNKSEIMNASIEMRFKHGIFLTPKLLGYDKDEDGNLVINEEEAQTVQLIFFMFLSGSSVSEICSALENLGRKTKRGNTTWSQTSVLNILQNERHCGDVLARKTYTPNYLDHKSKRNEQNRNQYIKRDHHEPIISRDDFIAVQKIIRHSKRRNNQGFLPCPRVIKSGILTGYVLVNPVWAGFKTEDYIQACESAADQFSVRKTDNSTVNAKRGDFDLRGYEIARAEFFSTRKISVTLTETCIFFSKSALNRLGNEPYVEILVHPVLRQIAVRVSSKEKHNSIHWAQFSKGKYMPRHMRGTAFLPLLFELFGWNKKYKYRISGSLIENNKKAALIFNVSEAEAIIPKNLINKEKIVSASPEEKDVHAYPEKWASTFGTEYYLRAIENSPEYGEADWEIDAEAIEFKTDNLNSTPPHEAERIANSLVSELKEKKND